MTERQFLDSDPEATGADTGITRRLVFFQRLQKYATLKALYADKLSGKSPSDPSDGSGEARGGVERILHKTTAGLKVTVGGGGGVADGGGGGEGGGG